MKTYEKDCRIMGHTDTLTACVHDVQTCHIHTCRSTEDHTGAGNANYVLKFSVCVSLTVAAMWTKWKRPGLRGRRGKCVHYIKTTHTHRTAEPAGNMFQPVVWEAR